MAASEIATMSGTIIQIAGVIRELGNNWYEASADWEDFPVKIAWLQRKHDLWVKEITRSDMLSDPSLMATLGEAEKLLEEEKAKLEGREARCGAGCWSKVSRTVFPAQIGLGIQKVIAAFDAIPGYLQMENDAAVALENRMMRRASSLSFRDDDRYVPLKVTESKVQEALNNCHGSPVVLLHGRPGKGKSTLTRHVALKYQKECKNPEGPFELVVFLECGPKADILTCQMKLAQLLGANTGATAVPREQGQTGSDDVIRRRLSGLLKHQRILIVFDDVWEPKFFQEMLNLCGVGVKCLVTSQNRELCRGLSLSHRAIQIQIEDIEDDVAMQILASHVGFPDKQIPAHLQGQAHKMVEGTEGNPLALASVASGIDQDRCQELVAWEAASENLFKLLHSTETAHTFGVQYSKSFWSAIQLSIQSLKEGAQILLILLHMCEAPSLPEELLRVLYSCVVIPGVLETFETSRKHLESHGLIQISSRTPEYDNDRKLYSWTLHSVHKEFIAQETSDEKETVLKVRKVRKDTMVKMLASQYDATNFEASIARLKAKSPTGISAQEDSIVQLSLCSLYFHEQYLKTAFKMETGPSLLKILRRNAIEPITRLLGLPVSERWTKAAQASAKQVYLMYIHNSALHESGILDLLSLSTSVNLPVLRSLEAIAFVEEVAELETGSKTTLIDENFGAALVKALLDFLKSVSDAGNTTVAMAAARVLTLLAGNKLHHGVLVSSGILGTIMQILLSSHPHPEIQATSTVILIGLTYGDEDTIMKVLQYPRMLEQLLHLTSSNTTHDHTKMVAADVVTQLTASHNAVTRQQLMNYPGLLEQLVNLLSQDNNPNLQIQAAEALKNLAHGDVAQIIVDCSGAVRQLLASTTTNNNPELELMATWALKNLIGSANENTVQQLMSFPGLLEQMVNLLSQENSLEVRLKAGQALITLSTSDNEVIAQQLLNFPGLVEQTMNLLLEENNPDLQVLAATVLISLARKDVTKIIGDYSCAVQQLLTSTATTNSPDLQLFATSVLVGFIQSGNAKMVQQLVNFPGLLEQMANLLLQENSLEVQLKAAQALVTLTESDNEITTQQLLNFPGLVEQMMNLLSEENSPDLQVHAAIALMSLARRDVTKIIGDYSSAIQQLLASTATNNNSGLQLLATSALVSLIQSGNENMVQQLVNFPGLLEQMVKLLLQENSPEVQLKVAEAFITLAMSGNEVIKRQLLNFPWLLEQRMNLLSLENSSNLQAMVAIVLMMLAFEM